MDELYKKINKLWQIYAPQYFWGDPLDVRFYLCKKLSKIKNKKILDVGCFVGIIMNCLDKSNEVVGIDVNEKALKLAKKINPRFKVQKANMFNLTLEKGHFDIIILAHVLPKNDFISERNPSELINYIKAFLKPGGKLFLTTPNAGNNYYKKKNKVVDYNYLDGLFKNDWDYTIQGWNPFPIQADHLLKYLPGIFNVLEWLIQKEFRKENSVSFYVEATKQH